MKQRSGNTKDKQYGDTMDRLADMDIDSDRSVDLDDKKGKEFNVNRDIQGLLMKGERAPRNFETMSEIDDPKERDAVFNHSITGGVFRNINQSPLRQRMPRSMRMHKEEATAEQVKPPVPKQSSESLFGLS
jgi:hypothetical protein